MLEGRIFSYLNRISMSTSHNNFDYPTLHPEELQLYEEFPQNFKP